MKMSDVDRPQKGLSAAETDKPIMSLTDVSQQDQEVAEMGKVFKRSEEDHRRAMDEISKSLTLTKAVCALEHSVFNSSTPLKKITGFLTGEKKLRQNGFGGLDGARKLLNGMIYEAASKYDAEIARCTKYYAEQCALMEIARGQISAANFVAATARALILDSNANIDQCTKDIPITKQELKDHNSKCKSELGALNKHLRIVMGDIAIMTMILEMSDCEAKLLQTSQWSMRRCTNECTNQSYVVFDHEGIQKQLDQLKFPGSRDLTEKTIAQMFDEENEDKPALIQFKTNQKPDFDGLADMCGDGDPKNNPELKEPVKTPEVRPPVGKTEVPQNPCTDPNQGAPSAANKRAAKCTLKQVPQCFKLQQRFLQIQGEIADARDDLMDQIASLERDCKEVENSLLDSIENDNALLQSSQTKLAEAMEKESTAGAKAYQVSIENDGYDADLKKQMAQCSTNYVNFETELCGLKKIRGDVFKKMKEGHDGFFQDCELSTWTPEECNKTCAGGEQKVTRSVLSHPGPVGTEGSACLPLSAIRGCNHQPCPVDCHMGVWSGWAKCSAKCGGGAATRVRDVKLAMKYGGKPCGAATESKPCNMASCEKDCELTKWTKWTSCSKDCDGGTKKRVKMIQTPAEGSGKCADKWHPSRLEYAPCNVKSCEVDDICASIKCNQTLDVILLLDGTPKSGKEGWAAEVKAANLLVDAFEGPGITAKPNIAVIHYTGPRTWSGVKKCTEKSSKPVDMAKDCKVKIATHFTGDLKKVKGVINGLEYAPGSKLLSLALMSVKDELALGRKTARTNVIVFIDGEPLSYRKTMLTSKTIRKSARLVYVPVIKFSPLKALKKWASRRWQENLVPVETIKEWASAQTSTHIVANICPSVFPELKNKKPK